METKDICKKELEGRISQIEGLLKSAKSCLKEGDFFQCAVRLELIAEQGKFSDFLKDVFESQSAS